MNLDAYSVPSEHVHIVIIWAEIITSAHFSSVKCVNHKFPNIISGIFGILGFFGAYFKILRYSRTLSCCFLVSSVF